MHIRVRVQLKVNSFVIASMLDATALQATSIATQNNNVNIELDTQGKGSKNPPAPPLTE